ncbi:MAG: hypothetical protein HC825_05650 [Oscillatoriales cyanobacterium RM1_1_9]|nr:hypothetical protein [Oscillatoriales cyanobacterium RM1_1_9]
MEANQSGLRFTVTGKIWNQFRAILVVTTSGMTSSHGFQVLATMEMIC